MIVDLLALARLFRLLNCLITALSVGVGGVTIGVFPPDGPILLAAAAAFLIAAAGYGFNDFVDVEIDRRNRPDRPLPSGQISTKTAALGSQFLLLVGLALAWWLSPFLGFYASIVAGSLFIYSRWLKPTPLWGNLLIASLAASAFPFGALAGGGVGRAWIPACLAFLFHLGREIIKDIEDIEGDWQQGAHTLPIRWGERSAGRLSIVVFAVLAVVVLLPWTLGLYGWSYLGPVLLVDLLLISAAIQLLRSQFRPENNVISRLLTLGMFLGLTAIVAGELLP